MANQSNQGRGGLPFDISVPGAGGLSGASLDTIGGKFREAVAWMRSGRERGITREDIVALIEAGAEAQQGNLDGAIERLRSASGSMSGLERLAIRIHLRKRPAYFDALLALLLTNRAVDHANKVIEDFGKRFKGDIVDVLRARVGYMAHQESTSPLALPRELRWPYDRLSFSGSCSICGSHYVAGEMRQEDGKSWRLCGGCIHEAQKIQQERKKALRDLAATLVKCRLDLEEAVKLDGENERSRENLKICSDILAHIGQPGS